VVDDLFKQIELNEVSGVLLAGTSLEFDSLRVLRNNWLTSFCHQVVSLVSLFKSLLEAFSNGLMTGCCSFSTNSSEEAT